MSNKTRRGRSSQHQLQLNPAAIFVQPSNWHELQTSSSFTQQRSFMTKQKHLHHLVNERLTSWTSINTGCHIDTYPATSSPGSTHCSDEHHQFKATSLPHHLRKVLHNRDIDHPAFATNATSLTVSNNINNITIQHYHISAPSTKTNLSR